MAGMEFRGSVASVFVLAWQRQKGKRWSLQVPSSPVKLRDPALISNASGLLCIIVGTSLLMAAFQTAPWRLISGILGGLCVLLMATLGILLKMSSDCCSCQEKWIGYQCICYFFSNEKKSWAESKDFCASQNSTLLQLKSKDEFIDDDAEALNFLNDTVPRIS
ncbi:natural killer cells antigen CD94-like [Rhynchocyon petersi]